MVHSRVVQHLKIDLIGVQEAEKRPEAKENRPLQPVDSDGRGRVRFCAISYLDSIFHRFNYTLLLRSDLRTVRHPARILVLKELQVRLFSER